MSNHPRRILVLFLMAVLAFGLSSSGSSEAARAGQGGPPSLFSDAGPEVAGDAAVDPLVVRSRTVAVDFGLLPEASALPAAGAHVQKRLSLPLFSDAAFTAVHDRFEKVSGETLSWIGHLDGVPLSSVVLTYMDGLMMGTISIPAGLYRIEPAGDGLHAVQQLDSSAFPPELDPIAPPPGEGAAGSREAAADGGDVPMGGGQVTIDVMVVYTPAARVAAGGTSAMQTLIALAVSEANTSYLNSWVNQQLRLVHTAEVTYTESGFSNALTHLQGQSDGYMDNIHTLRNTYQADEVVLIIEDASSCGLAYVMSGVSPTFEYWAFAVVHRGCATGYYSFGHELGHNMGARHDWFVDDALNSPYSYNKGLVNVPDAWRTVMSYYDECDCSDEVYPCPSLTSRATPGSPYCTRLQYWSNNILTYGGDPMGVPPGTSTSCTAGVLGPNCDADNSLTLNNTANTVKNWRPAHDDFDEAEIIYSSPYGQYIWVDYASEDGDDPVLPCGTGQHYKTLWYRYSPSRNGIVTVDTIGSNYDTLLGVWTGPRGTLASRACNDNALAGQQSNVNFYAISGMMYNFEVAAKTNITIGDLDMNMYFRPRTGAADFDMDGGSDVVVFRGGAWRFFDYTTASFDHGVWTGTAPGCIPAPMDYDGDGGVEFTQFCSGAWHFYDDAGAYVKGIWTGGVAGDLPVPADYDGDGTDDLVVWRAGAWRFFDFVSGAFDHGVWTGAPPHWLGGTSMPVPMDYDGDGDADFTVWSGGPWHFYNDAGGYAKGIWTGGVAGDLPVPADFDGDGTEEVVVWRAGAWRFFDYMSGAFDHGVWTGSPPHWLGGTNLPSPLDYDTDGFMEFTVWSGGPWHFYNDAGSYVKGIWTGGVAGDLPISRRLLP